MVVYDAARGDGIRRAVVGAGIGDENIVPAEAEIIDPRGIRNPGPPRPGYPGVHLKGRRPVRLGRREGRDSEAIAIEKFHGQVVVIAEVVIQPAHTVVRFAKGREVDGEGSARGVVAEQTLAWGACDRRSQHTASQGHHHWIRRHAACRYWSVEQRSHRGCCSTGPIPARGKRRSGFSGCRRSSAALRNPASRRACLF